MAKCPVCDTRKGKRKCLLVNDQFVCSLCCAATRKAELCSACVFYHPPQHNYQEVPAFSATVIANNHALQQYSQAIENAFAVDNLHDRSAMLELLINKYYFKETDLSSANSLWQSGFTAADNLIKTELKDVDEETLINLLGAMWAITKNSIEKLSETPA
jgi:hypothetical protein